MRRCVLLFLLLPTLFCAAGDGVVRVVWSGGGVRMSPRKVPGVAIAASGGYARIENTDTARELTFRLSGTCADGGLTNVGNHKVTVVLDGLCLESHKGSPMDIRCGKRVAVKLAKDTRSELTDAPDSLGKGVLRCKGHLEQSGAGSLAINARGAHAISAKEYVLLKRNLGSLVVNATGKGCKGVRTGGDFVMRGGRVSVNTTGDYVEEDTTAEFPPFPFDMDIEDFDEGMMFPPLPEELMERLAEGDFPAMFPPFGGDSTMMFAPPFDGEPPFRPRYKGTTKAVKALGRVAVEGGILEVSTSTPGAEGLEGKQGVELSGGAVMVSAYDDAINSNGKIVFSGADVRAVSLHNDAVDSNAWGDGAITISAGHVEVYSGAGPPEEGFDCDQWPIAIQGGEAFSVGSGMGPFPSMPGEDTATQPYLLFQNIALAEGDTLSVREKGGAEVLSVATPVANPMNHSLVTSPVLRRGATYELWLNGAPVQERQP